MDHAVLYEYAPGMTMEDRGQWTEGIGIQSMRWEEAYLGPETTELELQLVMIAVRFWVAILLSPF